MNKNIATAIKSWHATVLSLTRRTTDRRTDVGDQCTSGR